MKIAICGSMGTQQGVDLIFNMGKTLQGQGHSVLLPHAAEVSAYTDIGTEEATTRKQFFINQHIRKIEEADAILVTNGEKKGIAGYIGANTFLEMSVAYYLKKPIYLLNPIGKDITGYDEILGMKPVVLNGDLEAMA